MSAKPASYYCSSDRPPPHLLVGPVQNDCEEGHQFCGTCVTHSMHRCTVCGQPMNPLYRDNGVTRDIKRMIEKGDSDNQNDIDLYHYRKRHFQLQREYHHLVMELNCFYEDIKQQENAKGLKKHSTPIYGGIKFASSPMDVKQLKVESKHVEEEIYMLRHVKEKLKCRKESLH